MSVLGDLLLTIAKLLDVIVGAYRWIVIIAVIMSWFRPDPYNPIVRLIQQLTYPVFSRVRRWLPYSMRTMGIDWSPLLVLLALIVIESFVIRQIVRLGLSLS